MNNNHDTQVGDTVGVAAIAQREVEVQQVETSTNPKLDESPEQKRETTRSTIAKIYLCCFFFILAAGMVFCAAYAQQVDDVKDMLVAISGVLSGPLGFIIGYYFKASKE